MDLSFFGRSPASQQGGSEEPVVSEDTAVGTSVRGSAEAPKSGYSAAVRWIVYIGTFLVPLFFVPLSSNILELNKQVLLVVLASAGLVLWLLDVVISGKAAVRFGPIAKALGVFLLATVIVVPFSLARGVSVFGSSVGSSSSLLSIVVLTVFYFLAVNVFHDRGRKLASVLMVSSLIALVFSILQMFSVYVLSSGFAHSRIFNTIGSLNSVGILAAVMLPLFSKLTVKIPRIPFLDVAKLGVLASLVILAIMNWWVLWVVAIAGMLAAVAFDSTLTHGGQAGERRFRISNFFLPMFFVVLGVFLLLINFNFSPVKSQLPVEIAPSYTLSWRVAKDVLRENPFFGYGPENFYLAFDRFGAKELARTTLSGLRFYDGTSEVFNMAVHGGAVLLAALLLVFLALGFGIVRTRRLVANDIQRGDLSRNYVSGVIASTVALMAALLLYPFNTTLMFVWYVSLALTTLVLTGSKIRVVNVEEKPVFSLVASLGFIVGLIIVLAGMYFSGTQYVADANYIKALEQGDTQKRLDILAKAISWDNRNSRYYREASQASISLLAAELRKPANRPDGQDQAKIRDLLSSSVNLARQATDRGPQEADNWMNLALVYQSLVGLVDGADQLSEQAYLRAADVRRGDASFYNSIGSLYLGEANLLSQLARSAGANAGNLIGQAEGALIKAEKNFKKAIEISDNYGMAIYNLAATYDREGKLSEAIAQLEKIIPANADQPNILFELGLLYYRAGRKDNAFNVLQRAVVLLPSFANARWYLALIYEERRDLTAAAEQLEKILETNKDNKIVLTELDNVKRGKPSIPPAKVIDQKPLQ